MAGDYRPLAEGKPEGEEGKLALPVQPAMLQLAENLADEKQDKQDERRKKKSQELCVSRTTHQGLHFIGFFTQAMWNTEPSSGRGTGTINLVGRWTQYILPW